MDPQLFKDLIASIKEVGIIQRKKVKASRITKIEWPENKKSCAKTKNNKILNDKWELNAPIFHSICSL